jgi:hypothetical protein
VRTFMKPVAIAIAVVAPLGLSSAALAGRGGKPAEASAISLDESVARAAEPLGFGSTVTFTTVVEPLRGAEYPMIYTECRSIADGGVLYGELAHPNQAFLLGGGWSPWHDVSDADAACVAVLRAYGGKDKGVDVVRDLASTPIFFALG